MSAQETHEIAAGMRYEGHKQWNYVITVDEEQLPRIEAVDVLARVRSIIQEEAERFRETGDHFLGELLVIRGVGSGLGHAIVTALKGQFKSLGQTPCFRSAPAHLPAAIAVAEGPKDAHIVVRWVREGRGYTVGDALPEVLPRHTR